MSPDGYPCTLFVIMTNESGSMRGYLMVIRTFCQPEASEPIDTQRLTSSSTPLSSRDGESDDMRGYLMVICTFCQPEASEPVDTRRLTSSSAPFVNRGQ